MILFVRHGETNLNKQNIMQGRLDEPLNQTGIKQAQQTALALKNESIDIIYSSPLKRAKQTAQIINQEHNVQIVIDERINEIDLGDLTGTPLIKQNLDNLANADFAKKHNAEDFETMFNRCKQFYDYVNSLSKNILIVAHRGVGYQLKKYLNLNEEEFVRNCEVVTLKK